MLDKYIGDNSSGSLHLAISDNCGNMSYTPRSSFVLQSFNHPQKLFITCMQSIEFEVAMVIVVKNV